MILRIIKGHVAVRNTCICDRGLQSISLPERFLRRMSLANIQCVYILKVIL